MGFKLGDISPLAGAITGEGLIGNAEADLGEALGPMSGLFPALARDARRDNMREAAEEEKLRRSGMAGYKRAAQGMKKGGSVKKKPKASKASSRGDGIARKGKTKGRFV